MSFLPEGYEKPKSNSKYLRFEEGDNRFRILSNAITGWIDWDNKQPIRTKDEPKQTIDPSKPAKHFWAFVVWDYREKAIKILEITQSGIQNDIFNYHNDANWGDPKGFDLNVKRKGKDMNTKYSVIPTPPMPLHPEIKKLYSEINIDLNELYRGGDPFNPGQPQNAPQGQIEANNEITVDNIPF